MIEIYGGDTKTKTIAEYIFFLFVFSFLIKVVSKINN